MSRSARWMLAVLAVAAALRLQGLDWDEGQHLHPDERFLTMVAGAIRPPASVAQYLDTAASPLNPANRGHTFFVYGTFPLFLVRAVAGALGLGAYWNVHLVGRALSALFDVGTVWLTWRIGLLVAGPLAGIAAAALLATSAFSIQHAHFFTVDSTATFWATAALLALLRVARGGGLGAHAA
ncbi:MAG TPA: hypothetical protein VKA21_03110, partial [Candidatus Binatia bacterium]|nr:hypothetical protein [Candidatus Binatia bacterium]